MTVTSTVIYRITNAAGEHICDEIITTPCTAHLSDALPAVERLRLANEGSIKANIQRFIGSLIRKSVENPEKFGPALSSGLILHKDLCTMWLILLRPGIWPSSQPRPGMLVGPLV